MSDIPVEKRFRVLCDISRAQHFAWRQGLREAAPKVDPVEVVHRMWEVSGHETAKAYVKKLDRSKPLPRQLAESFVWSSQCMGEDAQVVAGKSDKEALVRHAACPWYEWHKRLGLLGEDQSGCDRWFFTVVEDVNKATGANVRIETTESLPGGGSACVRRIWVE